MVSDTINIRDIVTKLFNASTITTEQKPCLGNAQLVCSGIKITSFVNRRRRYLVSKVWSNIASILLVVIIRVYKFITIKYNHYVLRILF